MAWFIFMWMVYSALFVVVVTFVLTLPQLIGFFFVLLAVALAHIIRTLPHFVVWLVRITLMSMTGAFRTGRIVVNVIKAWRAGKPLLTPSVNWSYSPDPAFDAQMRAENEWWESEREQTTAHLYQIALRVLDLEEGCDERAFRQALERARAISLPADRKATDYAARVIRERHTFAAART